MISIPDPLKIHFFCFQAMIVELRTWLQKIPAELLKGDDGEEERDGELVEQGLDEDTPGCTEQSSDLQKQELEPDIPGLLPEDPLEFIEHDMGQDIPQSSGDPGGPIVQELEPDSPELPENPGEPMIQDTPGLRDVNRPRELIKLKQDSPGLFKEQ